MKSILVVEDDATNGLLLTEIISQETPYNVVLARDCFEAVHLSSEKRPDLFIIDYTLPVMTGIQLYDHLHAKEELHDIPAIMLTASFYRLDIQHEVDVRKIVGLSKPFELDELLETIEKALTAPVPRCQLL